MAALAAGGVFWYHAREGAPRYRTVSIERGPLEVAVTASGTLNPVATVPVASPIPGQVKEIFADFNTPVKKGQVLARLDPSAYESRVDQARARSVIRAPVDGTVILRNVDAGQTVTAGPSAPVLFTIAQDLHEMQIEATVPAADARRLKIGQHASFTVDALPRRSFSGEIRAIRKLSRNARKDAGDAVLIRAANPDLALLPGMSADVRIVVEPRGGIGAAKKKSLREGGFSKSSSTSY